MLQEYGGIHVGDTVQIRPWEELLASDPKVPVIFESIAGAKAIVTSIYDTHISGKIAFTLSEDPANQLSKKFYFQNYIFFETDFILSEHLSLSLLCVPDKITLVPSAHPLPAQPGMFCLERAPL